VSLSGSRRLGGPRQRGPQPVDAEDLDAAAAMAQHLLAVTDRSRVELRRRLEQRGYAPATAVAAVDALASRGWVDDDRLAADLAQRQLSRGYGRRRVLADLVARGVEPETVSRTAEGLREGQAEAVRIAAERLRPHHPGPITQPEVRRLAAALQRRGFDASDIRAELRRLATADLSAPDEEA